MVMERKWENLFGSRVMVVPISLQGGGNSRDRSRRNGIFIPPDSSMHQ